MEKRVPGLMKDLSTLEATIQSSMTHETPAVALAILSGVESTARGFGRTSVELDTSSPFTGDTLFLLGSVTKSLTATAIMRLVEQGLVELDRPISNYVSDLRFSDPAHGRRVTLRHLLSHTAGLSLYPLAICRTELLCRFCFSPLNGPPGSTIIGSLS